ncbi:hypothetical protein PMAYCL1PPCAC_15790 [Pristionchus mayeri]|uniref:G protein-coupled receptor n=1 Tax=Pristionchus mayeri TaxID=1317129 RepID=A0AAN5CJP0_9BILA|nr:hypothetical protein PMAYCL1PPCAC_15790 [Pristionchus mayeri]
MNLRFFYPDPDLLTVYGPANETYWLMLLVRSDLPNITQYKVVYYFAVIIEIISLLSRYVLQIRGFLRFWKLRAIHVNFLLIIAEMYSSVGLGIIARLLTILYETRILHVSVILLLIVLYISGLESAPIPFLAILRQAAHVTAFYVLIVVAIERTFATVYVADYIREASEIARILPASGVIPPCQLRNWLRDSYR